MKGNVDDSPDNCFQEDDVEVGLTVFGKNFDILDRADDAPILDMPETHVGEGNNQAVDKWIEYNCGKDEKSRPDEGQDEQLLICP